MRDEMPVAIYSAPSLSPLAPLLVRFQESECLQSAELAEQPAAAAHARSHLHPLLRHQALPEHATMTETVLPEELVIRFSALIDPLPRSKEWNGRSDIENALRLLKDDVLHLLKYHDYSYDMSGNGRHIEGLKVCPKQDIVIESDTASLSENGQYQPKEVRDPEKHVQK